MSGKMYRFILFAITAAFLVSIYGCSNDKKEEAKSPASKQVPRQVMTLKGKVLETMDAGNFLYVYLDLGDKKTWAAVPMVDVEIGEEVTLKNANSFPNFYSKTLQKSFDEMVFSSGIDGKEPKRREASLDSKKKAGSRRSMALPPMTQPYPGEKQ